MALTAAASGTAAAQAPIDPAVRAVPDGAGAWVLQVYSTGGFHGRGDGRNLSVSSDGAVTLPVPAGLSSPAVSAVVDSLRNSIQSITPDHWGPVPPSTCRDCYVTVVVLTLRGPDGIVRTYRSSWDPTTKPEVRAEIVRLHDLALTLLPQ